MSRKRQIHVWLTAAVLLLSGCASRDPQSSASKVPSEHRLYAVISAYSPETAANEQAFLGTNAPTRVETVNGVRFVFARYQGHELVLFPCGVSTVNAAMTTQLALDRFPVTHVLFAGIAGGINPAHGIGDVVIPADWAHHSEAAYFRLKSDGSGYRFDGSFQKKYDNFGFIFPTDVRVIRTGEVVPMEMPTFSADSALLAAARRALPTIPALTYENHACQVTVGGTGVTGPVFCDHPGYREWVYRVWKAECLDMESTAVAQVCWANHIPFLIVRSLSDLAGGQEGMNPEDLNEDRVSEHASLVLRSIIAAL